uniref:Uncharacterized protein n=1 Tax=Anguilla anguilla TaxID=7936 RepID=A0A0E9RBQ8_ANGAN
MDVAAASRLEHGVLHGGAAAPPQSSAP